MTTAAKMISPPLPRVHPGGGENPPEGSTDGERVANWQHACHACRRDHCMRCSALAETHTLLTSPYDKVLVDDQWVTIPRPSGLPDTVCSHPCFPHRTRATDGSTEQEVAA